MDNKKINTKSELCDLINGIVSEFRTSGITLTLRELIGNATSLEEATKNTLYSFSYLVTKLPVMKGRVVEGKFREYFYDNLDISSIYDSCYKVYNTNLDDFIKKCEKMSKLELQMEINIVEKAIDDYFVLSQVRTMSLWITFFRTQREYLEQYITNGKFLVRCERLERLNKTLNKQFEDCKASVPSSVKVENFRYGDIARTFVTVKDKLTGHKKELKTEKDTIMNYGELLQFVNKDNENNSYEIIAIEWCSIPYVISNLEYYVIRDYHNEVAKMYK